MPNTFKFVEQFLLTFQQFLGIIFRKILYKIFTQFWRIQPIGREITVVHHITSLHMLCGRGFAPRMVSFHAPFWAGSVEFLPLSDHHTPLSTETETYPICVYLFHHRTFFVAPPLLQIPHVGTQAFGGGRADERKIRRRGTTSFKWILPKSSGGIYAPRSGRRGSAAPCEGGKKRVCGCPRSYATIKSRSKSANINQGGPCF